MPRNSFFSHFLLLTVLLFNLILAAVSLEQQLSSVDKLVKKIPYERYRYEHSCNCCVCFALDDSGSIDSDEWTLMTNFVFNLFNLHFSFNMGRVRYGAVAFDHNPSSYPVSSLTSSFSSFWNAVNIYRRKRRGTNLTAGLKGCQWLLNSTRAACSAKTIVLLTDGFGSLSQKCLTDIKSSGTSIITVGIGSSVDEMQLDQIASNPGCAFRTDFSALRGIPMAAKADSPPSLGKCTNSLLTKITTKFCKEKVSYPWREIPQEPDFKKSG